MTCMRNVRRPCGTWSIEATRDRKERRHLCQPREDRRPAGDARQPRRALPAGRISARADGGIYRLSEDPDHRFALYASAGGAGQEGAAAQSHDLGDHRRRPWRRAQRRLRPARQRRAGRRGASCARRPAKEKTLRNGDVIAYLPDDFHHIETPAGSGNALHLHFYGLSLEHLPDRVSVDMASGTAKRFMAKAKILTPLLTVQQVKAMLKSGEVFAFFDVREEGEFSTKGHPLFATPLPLSRLEPRAFALLPDPAHAHRADGQRRGRPEQGRPRQPRRRHASAAGLHQRRRR